eukprot:CAMPEP_0171090578 /NCGR_PEP_ID=MMETSP0766_2-20121228/31946_1 /TAXON_ID=439317 /ORGANISM="Gambierdiscus australes, Strain CAWD 149" /LENGTH=115 /DNA_ID=CAMNT_0011548587 /DNA_START=60 /DNA_END=405 /DNA_ORIENTATION=-
MTSKAGAGADLRKFMEKRLDLKLTANRHVVGILRGYDQFMNIVLDNTVEIVSPTEKNEIGMVVIRGNSIMMWECLDRVKEAKAVGLFSSAWPMAMGTLHVVQHIALEPAKPGQAS